MGIDEIEWTFDPLQALNAYLNIARLGAVVEEYEENIYGESTSPLHQGSPTDRFIAVWRLTTPHVERRLSASPGLVARDAGVIAAPVVNPSSESDGGLQPGDPRLTFEDRRILVEIPGNFTELLARDPDRARRWRMATRLTFQTYLARGYRVVDFILASDRRRGQYVLARGWSGGWGLPNGTSLAHWGQTPTRKKGLPLYPGGQLSRRPASSAGGCGRRSGRRRRSC